MRMKLIIECGATKTDFCLTGENTDCRFRAAGINLSTTDMDTVSHTVRDAVSRLNALSSPEMYGEVSDVYFYGAGLVREVPELEELLRSVFPSARVELTSDLVAASRAVLGDAPGIAAILGTGSNSCLYDGGTVVKNVLPCGYVFGDYGSGNALGRMFLSDYFQGLMPEELAGDFRIASGADYASSVAAVYRGDAPARYLASFAPYILSAAGGMLHDGRPCGGETLRYAAALVKENFRTFIRRCLKQYDTDTYGVGAVGSFGYAAGNLLVETAGEENVRITRIMKSPMDGLIEYHNRYVQ